MEHNYLDPPDSVPLHSGNDASGNSGNDDYHSGGGGGNEHGNGNVNGNGIGNGNTNGKGDHRRQGKKNGNGNGNGNGRQGAADFEDPVIFVDQMETTEFVHRISITEPTTTMATTMATTTTTQPPSK